MASSFDVFLSYNSRDREAILQLAEALKARALRVWLDDWEMLPGSVVQEVLEQAILSSRTAAVVVGPSGLGPWECQEMRACISLAVQRGMRVIPVLLPGTPAVPQLPLFLTSFLWLDVRDGLSEKALDRLVRGIREHQDASPALAAHPPRFSNEKVRDLARQLEEAELRFEELTISGGATGDVRSQILGLKRELREGGRLQGGDSLLEGRFHLLEPIGKGGFSTVWKAFDRRRKELVAVKVLHGSHAEDRTWRERFFRGAGKMAELRHPGIVRVIETELADGGFHFFVMELVEGGDLRQAVLRGRLPPEEVLPVIVEVGEALSYAHDRGMIHRDVKPANILLSPQGPKLTDFDLVRAVDSTGGTHTQSMLGTFLYAAPEALQDAGRVEATADVYSLAMTTVFGLHGKDLPMDVLRHPERVLARLSCSEAIRQILHRALSWDPAERPGSVRELCGGLSVSSEEEKAAAVERVGASLAGSRPGDRPPRPGGERVHVADGSVLVFVPGGVYPMGAEDVNDVAKPVHTVTMSPFWIGKYPVTCDQYERFLVARPKQPKPAYWDDKRFNQPRQPVVGVSWDEARAYCDWAGLALPSEAQWEAAARGPEGRRFPWGGEKPTPRHANFGGNERGPTPVGDYPLGAGPFGTLDQAGNVWDWCEDVWDAEAYRSRGDKKDPVSIKGEVTGRSLRGGAWSYPAGFLAAAFRLRSLATIRYWFVGFRVCLPPRPEP